MVLLYLLISLQMVQLYFSTEPADGTVIPLCWTFRQYCCTYILNPQKALLYSYTELADGTAVLLYWACGWHCCTYIPRLQMTLDILIYWDCRWYCCTYILRLPVALLYFYIQPAVALLYLYTEPAEYDTAVIYCVCRPHKCTRTPRTSRWYYCTYTLTADGNVELTY